jgi:hypothetical protein
LPFGDTGLWTEVCIRIPVRPVAKQRVVGLKP